MPAALARNSFGFLFLGVLAVAASGLLFAHGAAAQGSTGTVTGRVLWSPCVRSIPMPMSPDAQGAPASPDAADGQSPSIQRPFPVGGLPAGAVLVAAQNTAVMARTDEAGRFTLSGVPAGEYLTVAAGPVANSVTSVADRPNVFVNGGQSVDIGTLSLGGQSTLNCRGLVPGVATNDATPGTPTAPGDTANP